MDKLINHEIALVVNTASGKGTAHAGKAIRRATLQYGIPCCTTIQGARATARAIGAARGRKVQVKSLQEYYTNGADGRSPEDAV